MSIPSPRRFLAAVDEASVRTFRGVVDRFLDETHERFPESASRLGLDEFNARLGRNDEKSYRAQIRLLEGTLNTIEKMPEASFSGDDWLDRRAFLAMIRTELLNARDLERWRNNPQIHCDAAVEAIFDLVIRHTENLAPVLPAIESRLAKLSDYLSGWRCLREESSPSLEQAGAPLLRRRNAISSRNRGRTPSSLALSRHHETSLECGWCSLCRLRGCDLEETDRRGPRLLHRPPEF